MVSSTTKLVASALLAAVFSLAVSACSDSTEPPATPKAEKAPNTPKAEKASKGPVAGSPQLGDGCTVESGYTFDEINTREGRVSCPEAQRVLRLYFDNVDTRGSFSVGPDWSCTSAPGGMRPYLGSCSSDSAVFEYFRVGWAREPQNVRQDCRLEPVDGAGFFNLEATDIPCGAAKLVIDEWGTTSCPPEGPCRISNGLTCTFTSTGYESGSIVCEGRGQIVTFDTAA